MTGTAPTSLAGAAAGFGVVAVIAGCAATDPEAASTTPAPSTAATTTRYTDGDYNADGVYGSLPSSIGVDLTLADGVITRVEVTPHATNETSFGYQEDFAGAVVALVVGRPIADLAVGTIAGSSGTPDGFNDALDRIRADAAA